MEKHKDLWLFEIIDEWKLGCMGTGRGGLTSIPRKLTVAEVEKILDTYTKTNGG